MHLERASFDVPGAAARPSVTAFRMPEVGFRDEVTFGDAAAELVVHLADPCRFATDRLRAHVGRVYVLGPRAAPFRVRTGRSLAVVSVRMAGPDLARLLGVPLGRLVGRVLPLGDACPALARDVEGRIDGELASSARALSAWVARRLATSPEADPRAVEAIRAVGRWGGRASVERVARAGDVHPRTLERLFARWVGPSPKVAASIVRARSALRALLAGAEAPSGIAVESGYADQAHMIRDIGRFMGASPRRVLARPRWGLLSVAPAEALSALARAAAPSPA
ncbi:MAG: helix-turn-helix domain-containing protein [Sandaracinaceae bacterium]